MIRFIVRLCITAATLLGVAYVVPGIEITGVLPAFIAAFLLGFINAIIRPILILLTLPVTILTLGLFIFVINATLFLWTAHFVDGFHVDSLFHALIGSILVSLVSGYVHKASK
jgi:putative membrane protein